MVDAIASVFSRMQTIVSRVQSAVPSGFEGALAAALQADGEDAVRRQLAGSQVARPASDPAVPAGLPGPAAESVEAGDPAGYVAAHRVTLGALLGTDPSGSVALATYQGADGFLIPVAGVAPEEITNSFGWPWGGHRHAGVDIFAPEGTPVVAPTSGVVEIASMSPIGGNRVWIRGDDGRGYYFAHLSGYAEGLQPGDHVDRGQTIGYVGTTGDAEGTPPHLHFAISRDNRKPGDSDDPAAAGWLDPGPFLGIGTARSY